MQHPDEGQIHAWLDSALPAGEASAFEAHLALCAECKAKIAEARGLMAGASRILSALDDVPRVVAPIARRSYNGRLLQAAALFIVVAGGGALIARTRVSDSPLQAAATPATAPDTIKEIPATRDAIAAPSMTQQRVAAKTAPLPRDQQARAAANISAEAATDARASVPVMMAKTEPVADAITEAAPAATPAPVAPLTVLKTEWSAMQTRTYYQVANKVVVLIEPGGAASRGFATGATAQSAAVRTRVGIAAASVGGPTPQTITEGDTLSWQDEPGGRTMLLVGPFSVAELTELKKQILAIRANR